MLGQQPVPRDLPVSPVGLSHQRLRAVGIMGCGGRCPFAPIALGCRGSQHPAELATGL